MRTLSEARKQAREIASLFTNDCTGVPSVLVKALLGRGFVRLGQGSFKTAYGNGVIAVKVPVDGKGPGHMALEYAAWKRATPEQRYHLVEPLAFDKRGLMVQVQVVMRYSGGAPLTSKYDHCYCLDSSRIAKTFGFHDYPQNHTHYGRKRRVVFFDYGLAGALHGDREPTPEELA